MKKWIAFLMLLYSMNGHSQLAANVMLPPNGFVQKQQLWNVFITNPGINAINVRIDVVLNEVSTGQPVLSASTGPLLIPTGTKQLSASNIGPVQYNVMNSNYRIDPGPTGLLPVGVFNVCYSFFGEGNKIMLQECHPINVESLSPLLLYLPAQQAILENENPTFNWIPFSSAAFFNNLTYSMKVVEIVPGQNATQAITDNPALFTAINLTTNNLFYGPNAPALKRKKQYAWQITAMTGLKEVVKSEIWDFSIGEKPGSGLLKSDPVYAKLKKGPYDAGYAVFYGDLRFEYFNETSDTTWNVKLTNISGGMESIKLPMLDTLKMQQGENLVYLPAIIMGKLQDKQIYLLELFNSRQEVWQLKFEYRKEEQ
jgi:hypothetical protein